MGKYIPFYWDTTFFLRGTAGNITPYGGTTVPVFERFFVGGIQTMRGFKYGAAGPLDPTTGDVIGATDELILQYGMDFQCVQAGRAERLPLLRLWQRV